MLNRLLSRFSLAIFATGRHISHEQNILPLYKQLLRRETACHLYSTIAAVESSTNDLQALELKQAITNEDTNLWRGEQQGSRKSLTLSMAQCRRVEEVVTVCHHQSSDLDHINIAAAYHRFAKLSHQLRTYDEKEKHKLLRDLHTVLQDNLLSLLKDCQPRQIACMILAWATIKSPPRQEVLYATFKELQNNNDAKLRACNAEDLRCIMLGLVVLESRTPPLLHSLRQETRRRLNELSASSLATLLWGLHALHASDVALNQSAIPLVSKMADQLKPRQVADILRVYCNKRNLKPPKGVIEIPEEISDEDLFKASFNTGVELLEYDEPIQSLLNAIRHWAVDLPHRLRISRDDDKSGQGLIVLDLMKILIKMPGLHPDIWPGLAYLASQDLNCLSNARLMWLLGIFQRAGALTRVLVAAASKVLLTRPNSFHGDLLTMTIWCVRCDLWQPKLLEYILLHLPPSEPLAFAPDDSLKLLNLAVRKTDPRTRILRINSILFRCTMDVAKQPRVVDPHMLVFTASEFVKRNWEGASHLLSATAGCFLWNPQELDESDLRLFTEAMLALGPDAWSLPNFTAGKTRKLINLLWQEAETRVAVVKPETVLLLLQLLVRSPDHEKGRKVGYVLRLLPFVDLKSLSRSSLLVYADVLADIHLTIQNKKAESDQIAPDQGDLVEVSEPGARTRVGQPGLFGNPVAEDQIRSDQNDFGDDSRSGLRPEAFSTWVAHDLAPAGSSIYHGSSKEDIWDGCSSISNRSDDYSSSRDNGSSISNSLYSDGSSGATIEGSSIELGNDGSSGSVSNRAHGDGSSRNDGSSIERRNDGSRGSFSNSEQGRSSSNKDCSSSIERENEADIGRISNSTHESGSTTAFNISNSTHDSSSSSSSSAERRMEGSGGASYRLSDDDDFISEDDDRDSSKIKYYIPSHKSLSESLEAVEPVYLWPLLLQKVCEVAPHLSMLEILRISAASHECGVYDVGMHYSVLQSGTRKDLLQDLQREDLLLLLKLTVDWSKEADQQPEELQAGLSVSLRPFLNALGNQLSGITASLSPGDLTNMLTAFRDLGCFHSLLGGAAAQHAASAPRSFTKSQLMDIMTYVKTATRSTAKAKK